jgi:hypothetical protein
MSQHDLNIANQGFPAFRADLNDALVALGSTNSGATAPATTYANQLWYDTANNILKIRNEDNDAWISIATLDQSGDLVSAITATTLNGTTVNAGALNATGVTTVQAGSVSAPAITTTGDTNTGIFFPAADTIAFTEGGVESMRIDSAGRLGIGTSSPNSQLNVSAASNARIELTATSGGPFRHYLRTQGNDLQIRASSGVIQFYTGNADGLSSTERLSIPSDSAGITFPATQVASANANTLDDYEEGTYTVTFTPSESGSVTLGNNTAAYTKIGRMVTVTGFIEVSSVSSPTGSHIQMNLPFTVADTDAAFSSGSVEFNVLGSSKAANIAWATLSRNTATVQIYDGSINSVGTGSFATYIVASTNGRFSITYFTS